MTTIKKILKNFFCVFQELVVDLIAAALGTGQEAQEAPVPPGGHPFPDIHCDRRCLVFPVAPEALRPHLCRAAPEALESRPGRQDQEDRGVSHLQEEVEGGGTAYIIKGTVVKLLKPTPA